MGRTQSVGKWGEDQACAFLRRNGFYIIECNYHATVGEIDIVATKGGDYYFLEVKTRRAGEMSFDTAVTYQKKRKLLKTIKHYCYHKKVIGSIIPASLMVVFNKITKIVQFRLAVIY